MVMRTDKGPPWRASIHRENGPSFSMCLTLEKNHHFLRDYFGRAFSWTFQLESKRLPHVVTQISSRLDQFPDEPEQRMRDDAMRAREARAAELEGMPILAHRSRLQ